MKKLLILVFFISTIINAMDHKDGENKKLKVYAIPGQNGAGSEADYVRSLLGEDVEIINIETPRVTPDFGQNKCAAYLSKAVSTNDNQKAIVHATSQGTATALNFLANEQSANNIQALILEAVLASGNRAIEHTLSGPLMRQKDLVDLPLSYYWIPYISKCLFWFYSPSGKQPIKTLARIPRNIPIIIVHSKNDMQLSYDDACAMYYGLRALGNDNVYLITKPSYNHIQLLDSSEDKKLVRNILHKHKVLKSNTAEETRLDAYQPNHEQYKPLYDNLLRKEKNHEKFYVILVMGAFCILAKIAFKYVIA